MIRGLNSILAQAHVPQSDSEKAGFASPIFCWCEFTHLHHVGVNPHNSFDVKIVFRKKRYSFQNAKNAYLGQWWKMWSNIRCSRTV
jgi:hypothetical protein